MLKLIFKTILIYYFLLTSVISNQSYEFNCDNTQYKRIKNLKNILEKEIKISIFINEDCKLHTQKVKKKNFNKKTLNIYEEILNFK